MDSIVYLQQQQINKTKWDDCIYRAGNALLYGCSGYLDSMAPGWEALVLNDYEMVMPLPCRKKMGIHYLFQPSITPALGIFGNGITTAITTAFLKAIPKKFKVWDLSFNSGNIVSFTGATVITRNNYVLDLGVAYTQLEQNYSENIQRNIGKATKSGCVIKKNIPFDAVADICKKEFPKFTRVENGLFKKLQQVYTIYKSDAISYAVFTDKDILIASAIFLFYKNRAYYWLVGNTPESKQYGASSLLINSFIKDHAGKNLLLDFEGSDTASVAGFYKKFGATIEPYHTLYRNGLSFPFHLLKPLPAYYRALISK
jgi:hypothetical protein